VGESTTAEAVKVKDMQSRAMSQKTGMESGPQGATQASGPHIRRRKAGHRKQQGVAQAAHTEGRGSHTGNTHVDRPPWSATPTRDPNSGLCGVPACGHAVGVVSATRRSSGVAPRTYMLNTRN